ncbi:MAG: alkaline phosphatase D family protein [Planctomycetaceae bacterium]
MSGPKVVERLDQAFGPVLYSMYTLSRGVLKMTAQMPPMGEEDSQSVELQVRGTRADEILRLGQHRSQRDPACPLPGMTLPFDWQAQAFDFVALQDDRMMMGGPGDWLTIARANIDPLSRTAHFRIPNWDGRLRTPYRLVYRMSQLTPTARHEGPRKQSLDFAWDGVIRHDPIAQETISVAGFTGNTDPAFPNTLLVDNVRKHNPDVLFFSGDQIYESVGGYGVIRTPVRDATNNYLRKIYLWGWAFRDLLKDRPSIVLPDDHDVYQGNVWGEGGKELPRGIEDHARGGFAQHPDFVNAVFRTQVAHHPDPFDATPMLQGIDCWYGDMVYGGISFTILEDRYFKSGPEGKVNTWRGRPDHQTDPDYDPALLDRQGLKLLGDRQLDFLERWSADWRGSEMKCVLSQTIFCNLANYHGPQQEFIFADLDSNGWPQTGRNKALRAMRKGYAFHYAGDQHLPSITQQGIDEFGDAAWSFCVPSIAAGYPRSWRPDAEGRAVQNRPTYEPTGEQLADTGEYFDGFGNRMSVYAIGNPERENRKPVLELLHDKSSGYGLVKFHKPTQTIEINCYRLLIDADNLQPGDQFPGWPRTIRQQDNAGGPASKPLATIQVTGLEKPLVQVIDDATGEIVSSLRIAGAEFTPRVYGDGPYTLRVSDPDAAADRQAHKERPDAHRTGS